MKELVKKDANNSDLHRQLAAAYAQVQASCRLLCAGTHIIPFVFHWAPQHQRGLVPQGRVMVPKMLGSIAKTHLKSRFWHHFECIRQFTIIYNIIVLLSAQRTRVRSQTPAQSLKAGPGQPRYRD